MNEHFILQSASLLMKQAVLQKFRLKNPGNIITTSKDLFN